MVFRGIIFVVLLLGVIAGRLICPCAPSPSAASPAAQAMAEPAGHAADHSCCHKTTNDPKPPASCPDHGPGCTHCGTILAAANKAVEAPAPVPAPAIPQATLLSLLDLIPPPPAGAPRMTSAPMDPSPPSLLSLYCILLT